MVEMVGPGRFQLPAQPVVKLSSEPFQPVAVNCILEPGIFTDRTVPVIPLNRNGLLGNLNDLLRTDETDYPAKLRIGIGITVRHPHPAADSNVKSGQLAVF
ncbi:hypothetical protein D3C85_1662770 [compost metagenome]